MSSQRADRPTLAACGVLVTAATSLLHEGLGHGGACLLVGGHVTLITSASLQCSIESWIVDAAGTGVNLLVAGLSIAVLYRTRTRVRWSTYLLWLAATVNLFVGTGYFLFSGVSGIGDWIEIASHTAVPDGWRAILVVFGALTYAASIWLSLRLLRPFLRTAGAARALCLIPYIAGGMLGTIAGLLNPGGLFILLFSAVAASFGGPSGLGWMWRMARVEESSTLQHAVLTRCMPLIGTAVVAALAFVSILGPGLRVGY